MSFAGSPSAVDEVLPRIAYAISQCLGLIGAGSVSTFESMTMPSQPQVSAPGKSFNVDKVNISWLEKATKTWNCDNTAAIQKLFAHVQSDKVCSLLIGLSLK